MSVEAEKYIENLPGGPCLIPRPESKEVITCHENDYCQCDIRKAYDAGAAEERKRAEGLAEACQYIRSEWERYQRGEKLDPFCWRDWIRKASAVLDAYEKDGVA